MAENCLKIIVQRNPEQCVKIIKSDHNNVKFLKTTSCHTGAMMGRIFHHNFIRGVELVNLRLVLRTIDARRNMFGTLVTKIFREVVSTMADMYQSLFIHVAPIGKAISVQ